MPEKLPQILAATGAWLVIYYLLLERPVRDLARYLKRFERVSDLAVDLARMAFGFAAGCGVAYLFHLILD
ncbi:MAG TPA: hypothetical protein DIW51_00670 [Rhodospirillaceae bacterium]|nr:hypothetical protein [Magnetovibrio sp.]HBT41123.1 hypothetical protein [Rhodospirillaceae bacterium]HCS68462.1 hypothetical protein [Rhodospirillaceae bacterium]|tara:strand:+ start:1881 stop:2090 length:210 start_codon:yes stop_codon:yes gene_type:complete